MVEILATLIVLPPLLAAVWNDIWVVLDSNNGEPGEPAIAHVAQSAAILSLLAILGLYLIALLTQARGQIHLGTWLACGRVARVGRKSNASRHRATYRVDGGRIHLLAPGPERKGDLITSSFHTTKKAGQLSFYAIFFLRAGN